MRAIRDAHPGLQVEAALRPSDEGSQWATVRVAGLPVVDYHRGGNYPDCWHELDDSLAVNRYTDGDLAAALRTAGQRMTAPSPYLTRPEVAARLRIPAKTLAQWAHAGTGPPFGKFGRHVRYHLADVEAWERTCIKGAPETGDDAEDTQGGMDI